MSPERDLAADLAAQIRAAVAETAPEQPRERLPEGSSAEEEVAQAALNRALAYVTPTVPEGAPFSLVKRVALRLFRFLWRDQSAFNALSLEAGRAAAAARGELLRRMGEDLARFESRLREDLEGSKRVEKKVADWISSWERRVAIENARLAALEAAVPGSETKDRYPAQTSAAIPPGVYSLFEERFRGTPEEIAGRQRAYLPWLEGIPGPVLDVGCGRGEFLRLLSEKGIPGSGVEINPIAAGECRKASLQVEVGDGIAVLERRPAESLGAVVAFQVVEHWAPEAIFRFLREARRALAPGGVLIAETVNVDSLSAWKAFYLDPTHVRPLPPEALRLLAEAAGFADTAIEYAAPLPPAERLCETTENDAKLNRLLFGPQDYALIARVPRPAGNGKRETGNEG